MTLTEKDIEKVRCLIREETADIRENMLTKDDAKKFATKEDLKKFATKEDLKKFATKEDLKMFATKDDAYKISEYTANLVMEKMSDQFRLFSDKLKYTDEHIKEIKVAIRNNTERIDLNSMKILSNTARITAIENLQKPLA